MSKQIKIQDAGVENASAYSGVGLPDWVTIPSDRLTYEFTVKTTNHEASIYEDGELDFNSNEIAAIIPPRFTVNFYIRASDKQKIRDLIRLQRNTNIKKITGGMGLISAIPESFTEGDDDIVFVIIKNMTGSEVVAEDTEFIKFTMQLEQVK